MGGSDEVDGFLLSEWFDCLANAPFETLTKARCSSGQTENSPL